MAYEMVMPYHLHMPSYFLETFTEYPYKIRMHGSNPYRASSKLYLLKLSTLKIFLFLCQIHCIVRTFT